LYGRARLSAQTVSSDYDHAMSDGGKGRLVYSSEAGRICPGCGWPANHCRCAKTAATESIPARIVAKLRMEKKGRGGKTVTVVYDLPNNRAFLEALCQELKRACGTGGAVADDAIELQGDLRERVRGALLKKGFVVKG
jgi:translation initiation factor 1